MSNLAAVIFGACLMIGDYLWMKKTVERKFARGYTNRKLVFYLLTSVLRWAILGGLLLGGIFLFDGLRSHIFGIFLGLTLGIIVASILTLKRKAETVHD